mgnify:CR=1 FL=1|jgi:large subunit ribosomal protein L33|tara:strand:+ start:845 stop:1048 length:204 start_codon:yes stop_codon:yes gene_type:complete
MPIIFDFHFSMENTMAKNANRVFVKMKSPESGYMYYTSKNRVTTPGRLELRKYDPIVRKHVLFKETK